MLYTLSPRGSLGPIAMDTASVVRPHDSPAVAPHRQSGPNPLLTRVTQHVSSMLTWRLLLAAWGNCATAAAARTTD